MNPQLNLFTSPFVGSKPSGEELKNIGMKKAEDTANELFDGWSQSAYAFLEKFVRERNYEEPFMCEDIRNAAKGIIPERTRAWGAIMSKGIQAGIIISVRTEKVKNPNAHRANANLYIKGKLY